MANTVRIATKPLNLARALATFVKMERDLTDGKVDQVREELRIAIDELLEILEGE